MAIVSCPECGKKLKVADTSVGKKVKGPCGHVFVAQGDGEPAPKPAAAAVAPEKVYVSCTECGSKLKVGTTSLGKKMKCPKCSATFVANLPEEKPAPAPKAKAKAKPAVTDADMDDLLSFAQADANGKSEADDDNPFADEPVKSRAQRKMDEEDELVQAGAPRSKGKAKPKIDDDDDDDEPTAKGKKPPRFGADEPAGRPVYPSRLLPTIFVTLMLLGFGGLVGAIFFEVNIAKMLGLPEAKGVNKPRLKGFDNAGNANGKGKNEELKAKDAEEANKKEMALLDGTWMVESPDEKKGQKFAFADGRVTAPGMSGSYSLDAGANPKRITLLGAGKSPGSLGIYELDGDTLKLCIVAQKKKGPGPDKQGNGPGLRPKNFDAAEGTLIVLVREKKAPPPETPEPKKNPPKDAAKLDGAWIIESALVDGKNDESKNGERVTFTSGKLDGFGETAAPYTVDLGKDPHWIDVITPDKLEGKMTVHGVFKLDGAKLLLCMPPPDKERPKSFDGSQGVVVTLRRATKDDLVASEERAAKVQVNGPLTSACLAYAVKNKGEFPKALQELVEGERPYLESKDALIDPWKKPYQYDPSGPKNKGTRPDIWTVTPDKKVIGNWPDAKQKDESKEKPVDKEKDGKKDKEPAPKEKNNAAKARIDAAIQAICGDERRGKLPPLRRSALL